MKWRRKQKIRREWWRQLPDKWADMTTGVRRIYKSIQTAQQTDRQVNRKTGKTTERKIN